MKNGKWIRKERAGSRKTIQDAAQEREGGGLDDGGRGRGVVALRDSQRQARRPWQDEGGEATSNCRARGFSPGGQSRPRPSRGERGGDVGVAIEMSS